MPSRFASGLLLVAGLTLGGCYSSGYGGGYGYGGVSVGFSSAGYYPGYYDPWYGGGWGYYAGYPYWGWHDGFYYPGGGIYVYDQWRRPHHWNDDHRRYWSERRDHWRGQGERAGGRREMRENWADFQRDGRTANRGFITDRNVDRRGFRQNGMRADRGAVRQSEARSERFRGGRGEARQSVRSDVGRGRAGPRRDFQSRQPD